MAASGVAEHQEARRRERVYLRKAWLQKQAQEQQREQEKLAGISGQMPDPSSTGRYQAAPRFESSPSGQTARRLGLANGSDPQSVDRQRRDEYYNKVRAEYSAKIGNRYTSIDYMSQW